MLVGEEHELGELDDGQADAQRQADAGGHDGQGQQKTTAAERHGPRAILIPRKTTPPILAEDEAAAICRREANFGRRAVAASGRHLGLVVGDALVVEQLLQLALLEHLADDVAAADELALDVELRDGRPVARSS